MNPDRIPLEAGDFVWTAFPYEDRPDGPGPIRHAAVVIAAFTAREAGRATSASVPRQGLVVGVFTSSQVGKFEERAPIGVIAVRGEAAARQGGQKPFFIDVRRRAFLPYDHRFFPDLAAPNHGVIGRATSSLMDRIIREYRRVNERHGEQIVNLGPLRPGR